MFHSLYKDSDIASALVEILKGADQSVPDFLQKGVNGDRKNNSSTSNHFRDVGPQAHGGNEDDEW